MLGSCPPFHGVMKCVNSNANTQAPSHSRILASVSWGQIHDVGIQRNGSQWNLFSDPPANDAMLSLSATKISLQRNPFKISKYSLPKTVLPRNKGSYHTFYANSFRESFSLCLCLPLSPTQTHLPTHTHIHTRTQHKHQSHKLICQKWRSLRSNMKHDFKNALLAYSKTQNGDSKPWKPLSGSLFECVFF